jgi:anti-anti-sigma regulatory factor
MLEVQLLRGVSKQPTMCVSGERDVLSTGLELEELVEKALELGAHLVLDVSSSQDVDGYRLSLLVKASRRLSERGFRLVLLGARPRYKQLLELSGANRSVWLAPDRRELERLLRVKLEDAPRPGSAAQAGGGSDFGDGSGTGRPVPA